MLDVLPLASLEYAIGWAAFGAIVVFFAAMAYRGWRITRHEPGAH